MRFANQKFELGQIVATPGAIEVLGISEVDGFELLARHVSGGWGTVGEEDSKENNFSVENGYRILSAYEVGSEKIWCITEADRSVTTLLLPSEY